MLQLKLQLSHLNRAPGLRRRRVSSPVYSFLRFRLSSSGRRPPSAARLGSSRIGVVC